MSKYDVWYCDIHKESGWEGEKDHCCEEASKIGFAEEFRDDD